MAVLVSDGAMRPFGWRGIVRCSLATETDLVDGWTRKTRIASKKRIHWEIEVVVANHGGYGKAV